MYGYDAPSTILFEDLHLQAGYSRAETVQKMMQVLQLSEAHANKRFDELKLRFCGEQAA